MFSIKFTQDYKESDLNVFFVSEEQKIRSY
jgi:hypothetical protein